jgi:hypothetical protein
LLTFSDQKMEYHKHLFSDDLESIQQNRNCFFFLSHLMFVFPFHVLTFEHEIQEHHYIMKPSLSIAFMSSKRVNESSLCRGHISAIPA